MVEDALSRAESLFKLCCDFVKLIDPDSISEKQLYSNNRRRLKYFLFGNVRFYDDL